MTPERRKALAAALDGAIRDGSAVRLGTAMCRELRDYLADLERRAAFGIDPNEDPAQAFKRVIDNLRDQVNKAKRDTP